jgi:DNA-binding protein Fis
MKTVQFLSNSAQIDKISKGLTLTKSLYVSSLLIGEAHTGKKTLIKTLFPSSIYVDASNEIELNTALETNNELIIYNFEKIINLEKLNFENKRIIAISNSIKEIKKLSKTFAFIYKMPTLREREDLPLLIQYFQEETKEALMIDFDIQVEPKQLELNQNIKSLKASLYKQMLLKTLKREDLKVLLYDYLFKELDGNNAYREYLGLYEEPLIKAGLKKYKSQLKLSGILGLNRNTLRKKIQEYDIS